MNSCLELVQNACQPLNDVQSRSLPACAPNWISRWSLSFDRLSKIRRRQVCGHIIALRRETMPAPQGLALPPQRGRQAITGRAANVLTLPHHEVRALYFENPRFGFYFLQLASRRLLKDKAR